MNKMCEEMHRQGYCICVTVECIWCDRNHPPHHPCEAQVVRAAVESVVRFLLWGVT